MDQSPIVHVEFLKKLSYDIISNIFLYLNQQDCLNCMATCREWYDRIPQYAQANWKTLELDKNGISQLEERNLGKHVKNVLFDSVSEDLLSKMMQKLLDCGCTEIESLEFIECISGTTEEQQQQFFNLLRRLASKQLTHLMLYCQNWDFSLFDLLFVCPHLTHFSYMTATNYSASGNDCESKQLFPSDQITYNTLIYLHVDSDSNIIKYQVQSIIRRSPNLRYFIGADRYNCRSQSELLIPPELVLSWCPQLEYYVGDASYKLEEKFILDALAQSSDSSLVPTSAIIDNNCNTNKSQQHQQQQRPFHTFAICDNSNASQIISHLCDYQEILRHLRIVGANGIPLQNPSGWTDTFQMLSMQQLRSLYCDNLDCRMESIVTLLNTCCNTIQEVQLQYLRHQLLDVSTFQALKTLPHLHTLHLKDVHFVDESSVVTLFERLPSLENLIVKEQAIFVLPEQAAPFLKNLKQLTFADVYPVAESNTSVISPCFLRSLAQGGSKLESITLTGDDDSEIPLVVLNALAILPSLKYLSVDGIEGYYNGKLNQEKAEQNLLQFFNRFLLECANDINKKIATSISTRLEDLAISDVYKMTDTMLNKLSELPNLQKLDISLYFSSTDELLKARSGSACLNVDLCGILDLLRKSKKLEKVVFRGVVSYGKQLPSHHIKVKLAEQQDNFQLRKYIVREDNYPWRIKKNEMLFRSDLEIINIHYKQ